MIIEREGPAPRVGSDHSGRCDRPSRVCLSSLPQRRHSGWGWGRGPGRALADTEIEQAARRFEALADEFDPEIAEVEDLADLRAIAEAAERTRRDEALLTERVA